MRPLAEGPKASEASEFAAELGADTLGNGLILEKQWIMYYWLVALEYPVRGKERDERDGNERENRGRARIHQTSSDRERRSTIKYHGK